MTKIITQVALDLVDTHRALQIAKEAVDGGIDWLEAGTPLIKSEGLDIIRKLRTKFPGKTIVADLKTLDTGGLEVEIATKAGASIVCIMGISEDSTITEAVKSARQYGSKIMIDLMRVPDKPKRAMECEKLGADYICIHVSIDEQMVGGTPFADLKAVSKAVKIPVAVAGGINSETAPLAVKNGASIVIIGGAITKSKKVTEATKQIVKSISTMKPIASGKFKKYGPEEIRKALEKVSTPNIADAMHTRGSMAGIMPFIKHNGKMVGQAVTVRTMDGDWAKVVEAIDIAQKGDVLVIDVHGGEMAVWGELASWSSKMRGISGIVIDGAIRDVNSIVDMGFPAFARHRRPAAGEPKGLGEIGVEITCGGQTVNPGDWIVGDESGVVVIPQKDAMEIANRALDVMEREERIREEIKRGSTLSKVIDVYKWEKK
ncbi:MAG: 3-hexulose-6-phosphate synthase [Thermoplasmata archaeon]|nr:3-hexulose-6-phosphate synthase [Thermoplasmata archaeon]